MRTAEAFYNIFMYLYNKNILKYGQIARNGTESMIPDTEGRSSILDQKNKLLPHGVRVFTVLTARSAVKMAACLQI